MPVWKHTNKSVTDQEAKKSLEAVKSACFICEKHSSDCSIARTANELSKMMEVEI